MPPFELSKLLLANIKVNVLIFKVPKLFICSLHTFPDLPIVQLAVAVMVVPVSIINVFTEEVKLDGAGPVPPDTVPQFAKTVGSVLFLP